PGAVNWMTAGRGITHSERSPESERTIASTLHGIQTWVALPATDEETDPAFYHYPADRLPVWEEQGAIVKLIAGQFQGRTSPVKTFSPTLYLDIQLAPGSRFTLPAEYGEQAVYSVTAGLSLDRAPLEQHRMAILTAGQAVEISSSSEGRCMVIGGEPMGQHYKWWNFVSSRRDRIEQAKQDWLAGKFESVPEETEFIPLPEEDATS
ncbi:MAG TPA: pirin-like C-terminal cupin domain-containing protein, partial [Thermosynechococcaceae cyanobacterium]